MKTLGVKFQVAGVKEAQASLNSLKTSLNQSLQQNKQVASKAIKNTLNLERVQKNDIVRSNLSLSIADESIKKQASAVEDGIKNGLKSFKSKARSGFNPVENILVGYQEAIGGHFGAKIGRKLDSVFASVFDFSFLYDKNANTLIGNIISNAFSKVGVLNKEIKDFASIIAKGSNKTENALDKFSKIISAFTNVLTSPLDAILTTNKKKVAKTRGAEEAVRKAQNIKTDIPETAETLLLGIHGYLGADGKSGKFLKNRLNRAKKKARGAADEKVYVDTVDNPATDVARGLEKDGFKYWSNVLRSLFLNNKTGISQDAIEMAAKAIAAKQQNPNIKIVLTGFSGGGFAAEEASEILNALGIKHEGYGIGTPNFLGGIKSKNFTKILSLNEGVGFKAKILSMLGLADISDVNQQRNEVNVHTIDDYLKNLSDLNKNLFGQDAKDFDNYSTDALDQLNEQVDGFNQMLGQLDGAFRDDLPSDLKNTFVEGLKKVDAEIKYFADNLGSLLAGARTKEAKDKLNLISQKIESSKKNSEFLNNKFSGRISSEVETAYNRLFEYIAKDTGAKISKPQLNPTKFPGDSAIKTKGAYNQQNNSLKLDSELARSKQINKSTIKTLIHEARHAIQLELDRLISPEDIAAKYSPEVAKNLENLARLSVEAMEAGLSKKLSSQEKNDYFLKEFDAYAYEFENTDKIISHIQNPQPLFDKSIKQRYKKYLDKLATSATEQAQEIIKDLFPDYKNFNAIAKTEAANNIKGNAQNIAKLYRKAVTEGNLKLARELVESLLVQVQVARSIYSDLQQEIGSNKDISSGRGELTKLETEVRKGQPNLKGYSDLGIEDLVDRQLQASGNDVVEGFIAGIEADLAAVIEAGESIGDAVQEGTDENLGIESPAKEFILKGYQVAEGFIIGIRNRFGEVRNTGSDLGEELAEGTEESSNGFKRFFSTIDDRLSPILNRFKGILGGIATLFIGGLGIRFAINLLNQLGKEALSTAMALESIDRAIVFISRNPIEGLSNLQFITQQAKQLSVDLSEAKQAYSGLLGAAKNTPLEGMQTQRLFSAFAASAANRGLDAQSQNRLFTALEQIIAKRKLGAEEVVQQIGDIRGFGDFKGLVGQAMGVSSKELDELMRKGEVRIDVLPKIVALIEAQNAAADGTQTAQQALTKYNNSLLEFKGTLGGILQPLEKLKLNVFSSGLDFVTQKLELIFKLIRITGGVALLAMFGQVNLLTIANIAWSKSINLVTLSLQKLWAAKFAILGTIGKLVAAYGLVLAAYLVWSNVIKLSKNQYQDLEAGADKITAGIDRYAQALEAATKKQDEFNKSQGEFKLNEGVKLPEWLQGIAGGDHLNLDNLIRKRLDWLYDRPGGKYLQYGPLGFFKKGSRGNFTTEAERREADLTVAAGNVSFATNQLLLKNTSAIAAAEKINKFDEQIRAIQAKRLELLPGDKEAIEASLAAERAINSERDKYLKVLTTYQQELQTAIAQNKAVLATPQISETTRKQAENDLAAAEKELNKINNTISKYTKQLSEFERRLRNSNERINNYIERRGLEAQVERTQIINDGLELSKGDRTIQLEIDAASKRELNDYISELEETIEQGRKRLQSGALAEGYKLVRLSAKENNLTLDSKTIQRLLTEERDEAQKNALTELLEIRENETKLNQYREQLAQNLQSNRNSLIDYNRTVSDFFFRLNQQIAEAQLEVQRIVNQIIQTQIRNKLQSALSPNAESFVNQLISSTQSLLDQAASYAEKVLGQKGARIQLAGQKRSLQLELQDFARNIGGASEALDVFARKLKGEDEVKSNDNSNNFATKTKQIAQKLGIDPHALMTIMLFESAGTLSPKIQGANVPGQGRGRGLIQFMPATAKGLGTSDAELAEMTDIEQLDWVEKYFAQFSNFGAGKLENLYAAVLAGNPLKVNASDGYVTARIGARKMIQQYGSRATELLNAEALTNQLIEIEQQKLDLQDYSVSNQDKEALQIAIDNQIKSDRRKVNREIQDKQYQLDDQIYAQLDLISQYDFQTAPTQAAKDIRAVNQAFSQRWRETVKQIQFFTDEVNSLNKIIADTPKLLNLAQTPEDKQILLSNLANAQKLLPEYQAGLDQLIQQEEELITASQTALNYVNGINELKIEQEKLNKRSLVINQRSTLAEARGTIEAQRKLKLHQEELRLQLEINKLRQQYAPGEYLDSLIRGEQRQSAVNRDNINYDSQLKELELERRLIDMRGQIGEKNTGFLSRLGFNFKADKLRKDNAIAQENLRFQRELIDLQKEFANQPDKLAEFIAHAEELNRVNLGSISNQFKSLRVAVEDFGIERIQKFFEDITLNLFDNVAERDRALLDERLRYAEELNQLNEQHQDEPGMLAHLKNRARELNEQKLDKIKNEFSLLRTGINLARQALLEFVKQLAVVAARAAAAKFLSSIFGGLIGGVGNGVAAVGNDFGAASGLSAFTADKGYSVGIKSRKLSDRLTNYLRENFPGVQSAWNAEGEGAQLGVFHTGEELLSRKTGEAGRYQALKQELGINPLAKIGVFKDGGTVDVGSNILSGFSNPTARIDLSQLNSSRRQAAEERSKTVNISTTVVTPNADSFRANQDQINQDLVEKMRRGI